VFVRHRRNWAQLLRFGIVGGSGVIVNMAVLILFKRIGPDYHGALFPVPLTSVHVRWYHVMVAVAFLVANFWNFLVNRRWTFGSHRHTAWHREYLPFLAVGVIAQIGNLALVTALVTPGSPIDLPGSILNDTSGFRTKLYWAQMIAIAVVMPVSFVVNKLWTFSAVRRGRIIATGDAASGALQQPSAQSRLP
jgi:putative flippase GtrA